MAYNNYLNYQNTNGATNGYYLNMPNVVNPSVTQSNPNYNTPTPAYYNNPLNNQIEQNNNGINWVQGEAGAKSYPVAPNQSVMLMDSEENVFYIKTVDSSGMPLPLRIFDYTERTVQTQTQVRSQNEAPQINMNNYITREEFEKRLSGLRNNRKERNNGKSSIQSSEQ